MPSSIIGQHTLHVVRASPDGGQGKFGPGLGLGAREGRTGQRRGRRAATQPTPPAPGAAARKVSLQTAQQQHSRVLELQLLGGEEEDGTSLRDGPAVMMWQQKVGPRPPSGGVPGFGPWNSCLPLCPATSSGRRRLGVLCGSRAPIGANPSPQSGVPAGRVVGP